MVNETSSPVTVTYEVASVAAGCANIEYMSLTIYGKFSGGSIAIDGTVDTICYNTTPLPFMELEPSSGGKGLHTYQWQKSVNGTDWEDLGGTKIDYTPGILTTSTYFRRATYDSCGVAYSNTILITVIDSLQTNGITSNLTLPLNYNTSSDLSVNVTGGGSPYRYKWYKRAESETAWTLLSDDSNTVSTGNLIYATWFKVEVSSAANYPQCNTSTDSLFVDVNRVELSLDITGNTSCSSTDSIMVRVINTSLNDATNVTVEFDIDATLPEFPNLNLPKVRANSDTTVQVHIPVNSGNTILSGNIRAEITGCDMIDMNLSTVYGSWKSSGWAGVPSQSDEDSALLTIYPDVITLTSPHEDTICSGTIFNYTPTSTASGISYAWSRSATADLPSSTGTGSINDLLYNSTSDHNPVSVTYTYINSQCPSTPIGSVTVLIIDSLFTSGISSSETLPLGGTGTDLIVTGVQGGISPYLYSWYKRTESETTWTEMYVGTTNTISTGDLTENTWYKLITNSANAQATCNLAIDSILVEVLHAELKLQLTADSYAICNTVEDKIKINISNLQSVDAENVSIAFKNEGTLPLLAEINLPVIRGNSDTTIIINLPSNVGYVPQTGLLKAEIISCDIKDVNQSTVYGSWQAIDWTGEPTQADEDMINLTIYPVVNLMSKLNDTICSGQIFHYEPQTNIEGTIFSWTRYSVAGIDESFAAGTGSIDERLTNIFETPTTVTYEYILTASESCSHPDTSYVEVLVNPVSQLRLNHYPEANNSLVFGTPITIVAETEGPAAYSYTYKTKTGSNTILSEQDEVNEYKIYDYDDKELNKVEVTVTNVYGCMSEGEEEFQINYQLPNIITPKGKTNARLLKGYYIEVFNRTGSQIYRGKDGWDGTYKGAVVASATYLYVLYVPQDDGTTTIMKKSVFVKY
jgi:hypothetical protein